MPFDPRNVPLELTQAIGINKLLLRRSVRESTFFPASPVQLFKEALVLARFGTAFVK